jgi:hypothetical protein
LERRTPRLLPHFDTRVVMVTPVSTMTIRHG